MKEDKRDYVISVGGRRLDTSRNSKKEERDIDGGFTRHKMLNKSQGHSYRYGDCGKILRKWIYGQVGKNWDDVYSDFKAICKANNLYEVDVNWWVELDAQIVDGELITSKGIKIYSWKQDALYVDKNNILRQWKRRRLQQKQKSVTSFWIDEPNRIYAGLDRGIWYIFQQVWRKTFSYSRFDTNTHRFVQCEPFVVGGYWEIIKLKQMSKKEKKKHGIS